MELNSVENEVENTSTGQEHSEASKSIESAKVLRGLLSSESDVEDYEDRSRTPSGTVIENKVSKIRENFIEKWKLKTAQAEGSKKVVRLRSSHKGNQSTVNLSAIKKFKGKARRLSARQGQSDTKCKAQRSAPVGRKANKTKSPSSQLFNTRTKEEKVNYTKKCELLPDKEEYSSGSEEEGYFTPKDIDLQEPPIELLCEIANQLKMSTQDALDDNNSMATSSKEENQLAGINTGEDNSKTKGATSEYQGEDEMEVNDTENPAAMGVASVAVILQDLKSEMAQMRDDIRSLKDKNEDEVSETLEKCKGELIDAVSLTVQDDQENLKKLKNDLKHFKFRNRALTNIVENMSVEIAELRQKMENIEMNTCRNAISISGVKFEGKKQDRMAYLENFLRETIQVNVNIEDCYQMGSENMQINVVYLQNNLQKKQVMENKSRLKNIKGYGGKYIYINEYLPAAVVEKRKRDRDIFGIAQEKPEIEVKYHKGKLTVQGEIYSQKIVPPSPRQLVDHIPEELERILKMDLHVGGKVRQENSSFEGYTASVSTLAQVRDLYTKVKLMVPTARHVVCGFQIPGNPVYNQDFCDDGEPGAGRVILDFILRNQLQNRVIFIARKYGGIRMGASRFECYLDAAKLAFQANTYNSVLKQKQHLIDQSNTSAKQQTQPQKHEETLPKRAAVSPPESTPDFKRGRGGYNGDNCGGRRKEIQRGTGRKSADRGARGRGYGSGARGGYTYEQYLREKNHYWQEQLRKHQETEPPGEDWKGHNDGSFDNYRSNWSQKDNGVD